jgi:hypothetical protein
VRDAEDEGAMILQNVGNFLPSITYQGIHIFRNNAVETTNLVGDTHKSRGCVVFFLIGYQGSFLQLKKARKVQRIRITLTCSVTNTALIEEITVFRNISA